MWDARTKDDEERRLEVEDESLIKFRDVAGLA
jgi:hypothetical protein